MKCEEKYLSFSVPVEHDVKDVLATVPPTAISRQLWETAVGVWRSEARCSKQFVQSTESDEMYQTPQSAGV